MICLIGKKNKLKIDIYTVDVKTPYPSLKNLFRNSFEKYLNTCLSYNNNQNTQAMNTNMFCLEKNYVKL